MGRMMRSLLRRDPSAIFLMMGSSRSGVMPVTYCGVAATSSTVAAETFAEALTAMEAVSSMVDNVILARVAMSSRRAKKPDMGAGVSCRGEAAPGGSPAEMRLPAAFGTRTAGLRAELPGPVISRTSPPLPC